MTLVRGTACCPDNFDCLPTRSELASHFIRVIRTSKAALFLADFATYAEPRSRPVRQPSYNPGLTTSKSRPWLLPWAGTSPTMSLARQRRPSWSVSLLRRGVCFLAMIPGKHTMSRTASLDGLDCDWEPGDGTMNNGMMGDGYNFGVSLLCGAWHIAGLRRFETLRRAPVRSTLHLIQGRIPPRDLPSHVQIRLLAQRQTFFSGYIAFKHNRSLTDDSTTVR